MYRKIVAGYRDEEHGAESLGLACALADPAGAEIVAATVLDGRNRALGSILLGEVERARGHAIDAALQALPSSARVSSRVVCRRSAANGLTGLAEREGADLLVLGPTRHNRLGRLLLGPTAERLLHGDLPVAIAPDGYEAPLRGLRTIALGFDGTAASRGALDWARELAAGAGAELELVPAAELETAPVHDVDLLVVGSARHGALGGLLHGHAPRAMVRDCTVPVVTVPLAAAPRAGTPVTERPAELVT